MNNFIKHNNLLFLSICLIILFSLNFINYYQIVGNDNSIILSQYQFFSKIADNFSIENKILLIDKDKINFNNEFLISYFKILLNYFNIAPNIQNKIYLFLILYIGTISLYKLSSYFFKNNIISIVISLLFFISPGFIDYHLMGWNYVLTQLYLSPCFFYLTIKYFEQKNKLNVYLIYIFLNTIFLLFSIQSIFLIFFIIIFSFYFYNDDKFFIFLFFLILFTLFCIQFPIFAILVSDNYNDLSNNNLHSSSISKGLSGVINPFFNFLQSNNLVNNFSLHISADNNLKKLMLLIPGISWLGYAIFISKIRKNYNNFLIFFGFLFLLEFGLYFIYNISYFFTDFYLINKFFTVFRDPSRIGNINNFLIYIFLGYALNYFYLILKRIELFFFFKIVLFTILITNIYIYYKSTLYNSIPKPELSSEFNEKNFFLENTSLRKILFLPIKTNVSLNTYATNYKSIETLDPVKRFSLNNTFFWNTDKSNKTEKNIVNCDLAYNNIFDKIDCINNINIEIHYIIDKIEYESLFFDPHKLESDWLIKNPKFTKRYFKNFILFENKQGLFDNKISVYGLYKNKINEKTKYFKIYDVQKYIDESKFSFKNLFLVKFLVFKNIINQKILNTKLEGNYLYYNKNQFYLDCMMLISSIIYFFIIIVLIFLKIIKYEKFN